MDIVSLCFYFSRRRRSEAYLAWWIWWSSYRINRHAQTRRDWYRFNRCEATVKITCNAGGGWEICCVGRRAAILPRYSWCYFFWLVFVQRTAKSHFLKLHRCRKGWLANFNDAADEINIHWRRYYTIRSFHNTRLTSSTGMKPGRLMILAASSRPSARVLSMAVGLVLIDDRTVARSSGIQKSGVYIVL